MNVKIPQMLRKENLDGKRPNGQVRVKDLGMYLQQKKNCFDNSTPPFFKIIFFSSVIPG